MIELSIVVPTFKSRDLALGTLVSFRKFCPPNLFWLKFVVVENSDDISYKNDVLNLGAPDVKWINNPTDKRNSWANASGVSVGLEHVETEYAFICHCDVFVTSMSFYDALKQKIDDDFSLVGTVKDPSRINAIHISGLLTKTQLAKSVDMDPFIDENNEMKLDVGDRLTEICRLLSLKHCCFDNTFNDPSIIDRLTEPFRSFHVDRCVVDNKVIFMHLGRGIDKTNGVYSKPGRVDINGWNSMKRKLLFENLSQ